MSIDWIVAIVTFLVLVTFSFNYYTGFFVYHSDLGNVAGKINQRVLDTIMVGTYRVPVYYNSSASQTRVLYMDFSWPNGTKNSTSILLNGIEQPCIISGDRIYWQSGVVEGDNIFEMTFSNISIPMRCEGSFTIQNEDEAIPRAIEKNKAISQGNLNSLSLVDYNEYRKYTSISRDIRIETKDFSYGPLPPKSIDVYAFEKNTTIAETGEHATIRVLVW